MVRQYMKSGYKKRKDLLDEVKYSEAKLALPFNGEAKDNVHHRARTHSFHYLTNRDKKKPSLLFKEWRRKRTR